MVVIGLGTNLADRSIFKKALHRISGSFGQPLLTQLRISPLYRSQALLPDHSPTQWNIPYLNMAFAGNTTCSPHELLTALKHVEKDLGRETERKWAPRLIDLDILAWDQLCLNDSDLNIPHPGLCKRPFALWPLTDLAPDWIYPGAGEFNGRTAEKISSRWRGQKIPFETRRAGALIPELMGIINVTPDSFSDGGENFCVESAVGCALNMTAQGATILDFGAESTRPGAIPLSPEEEWTRLHPVLKELKSAFSDHYQPPKISIDTRHHDVAKRALLFGVDWINDVTGLENSQMCDVIKDSQAQVVIMHHLGIPPDRNRILPHDLDTTTLVFKWGQKRIQKLLEGGLQKDRLIFDPGLGFGKSPYQCLHLMRNAHRFGDLGVPLLIGHSRKSFMNLVTRDHFKQRELETALISDFLSPKGVDYLRVHDVVQNSKALMIGLLLREP